MQIRDIAQGAPVRMLTAPSYDCAVSSRPERFFDTSPSTPREMLKGHVIVYYSPVSLDYEPVGEPERTPTHQGRLYYVVKLTSGDGFNALDSRQVMPEVVANARWRNLKVGAANTIFTTVERWSRAYVIEQAERVPNPPRAKDLLNLPPNWAFRMGVRPLLLGGDNREAVFGLEVEEAQLPDPEDLPFVVRGVVATALRRAGYKVDIVTVPDSVYAIEDPARPGLLKIGCGTAADGESGCQRRLEEARRWTAGKADFAIKPFRVGTGIGELAEAFVHEELEKQGRIVYGEWYRASPKEVDSWFIKALGFLAR